MPDNTPEDIEREMRATRSSLSEKIETLEEKVTSTVAQATEAVSSTVTKATEAVSSTVSKATEAVSSTVSSAKAAVDNTVKSVSATVANVRETFDLPEQVRRHPWMAFAGAIAAGYLLEKMCDSMIFPSADAHGNGNGKSKRAAARGETPKPVPRWMADSQKVPEPSPFHEEEAKSEGPSVMSAVGEHMAKLKDIAVGALFNVLRGVTVKSLGPTFAEPAGQFVDDVARSFGVTPKSYAAGK
jgi:ElaB/YqjD/DUF883 family membrane-anchored ribosome-binding protein